MIHVFINELESCLKCQVRKKSMSKVNLKSLKKMETSRLKNLLKESHEMLELGKNSTNPGDMSYLEEWIQVAEMELKKRE